MQLQPNSAGTRQLFLQAGFALFLLGLLTGLVVPLAQLPRMALSSHLEGVMNGMFLVLIGLCWSYVELPRWAEWTTLWAAISGTYANWIATLLSAFTGAASMMPIAGMGSTGEIAHEVLVAGLLVVVTLAMIVTCLLVLWGLWRAAKT